MKQERKIFWAEVSLLVLLAAAALLPQLVGPAKAETKETAGYTALADLDGKRMVIVAGEYGEDIIDEYLPAAGKSYVNSQSEQALSIVQRKADGMVVSSATARGILAEYPQLRAIETDVGAIDFSFATQKNAAGEALAAEYDAFVAASRASGLEEEIYARWFKTEEENISMPDYTYSGEKGTLNVTVNTSPFPYCYIQDGEITGYDIELARAFCAYAGYTPQFESVEFTAALAGLAAGKYEFLAISIVVTPERAESLTFTAPHFTDKAVALVLDGAGAAEGTQTASKAQQFWSGLKSSFEKNFLRENRWQMLLSGLGVTLLLAVSAAAAGTLLGALICLLYRSRNPFAAAFARLYVQLFRGTPIVVLLLILYYVLFGSADMSALLVCIIGFSLDFAAYVSEIFRMGIDAVPPGQARAAMALGFSRPQAFMKVVLPQAMRHILPVYRGQFIAMVKMTSVAGYISVEDLTKVSDIIRSRTYEAFFPLLTTAAVYFLLATLLASSLKLIEKRTDPAQRVRAVKGVDTSCC